MKTKANYCPFSQYAGNYFVFCLISADINNIASKVEDFHRLSGIDRYEQLITFGTKAILVEFVAAIVFVFLGLTLS